MTGLSKTTGPIFMVIFYAVRKMIKTCANFAGNIAETAGLVKALEQC
jgi:hypothetical protein